ncbi:DctP family TRAP transporter solute-binding subunit [Phycicoccus flavus]|uniref:DctP family TRAP transporter solute-binding subunit n=1 Tax=Phycicoccus flavus TaxID=2502783 RepID=UPI000FEB7371|nr:DctP family TRAP transporter solute-binding subunit [Phycicoccus flavus]NHA68265.1 DctP family TRAP transporter solute-binding subunit [Phycicoccus flavus]
MTLDTTRRGLITGGVGAIAALALGACGSGSGSTGADESRSWILGHGAAPGNPRTIAADQFAKAVSEGSAGRLTVQVQGSEQLGSDAQMLQSVKTGTLAFSANSQGPLSADVPQVGLIGLPFLFDEPGQAYEVLDGEVGDQLAAEAEKKGFKVLAWWDNGIRDITNNARPINSPADVEGLKIRTPEDPMTVDIFSALGANPTPLAFGELYLALRQGTVDGQENPLTNIASAKLDEVQKYLALTGHKYEATPFVMNLGEWEKLSDADQQVVLQAAEDARDAQRTMNDEQNAQLRQELANSMTVTEPDKEAFREATKGVYDKYGQQFPDLVKALQDAAGSDG